MFITSEFECQEHGSLTLARIIREIPSVWVLALPTQWWAVVKN